jgi:hydroxymethylpyrimidine/phosphomethylpyrimidine kinase
VTKFGDPPVVLTIAGSDSGSGAGIQADIRTMAAFGVLATTAVTAVTAQNTTEVRDVHRVPTDVVISQIRAVVDDLPVSAVKTGLLADPAVVEAVGSLAASGLLPRLVVDPVMVASTGRVLLSDRGVDAYRTRLLPHALVVTPNLFEAALLAGVANPPIHDVDAMADAARVVGGLGPTWVLVKGGHLPGVASDDQGVAPAQVADVLFDGIRVTILRHPHVDTPNTHGTGCSLSAAIAAQLARGTDVPTAVATATQFVHGALLGAAGWRLGKGHGPIDHLGWSAGAVGPGGGPTAKVAGS